MSKWTIKAERVRTKDAVNKVVVRRAQRSRDYEGRWLLSAEVDVCESNMRLRVRVLDGVVSVYRLVAKPRSTFLPGLKREPTEVEWGKGKIDRETDVLLESHSFTRARDRRAVDELVRRAVEAALVAARQTLGDATT